MISSFPHSARFIYVANAFLLCALAMSMTLPQRASAASIVGDITMSGDLLPTGGAGDDLSDATGLDFLGDDFNVDAVTGVFATAGISVGDVGVINDFQFNPLSPDPVDPLWTIAGFAFTMDSVSVTFQNSLFLILEGTGTITHQDFGYTSGTWQFSANKAGALFNFSSGFSAVPEPSTPLLLSAALTGIGFLRRRRQVA